MSKIAIIRVNFISDNVLPDGNIFGKVGEHNANILEITPPNDMTENESIKLYCLAFEVGRDFIKKIVRSEMIAKADVFQIPLWSQVTVGESVKFQLEAYDGESNLLVKSKLVEGVFLPSVNGVDSPSDPSFGGVTASVAQNTLARHTHENAEVLNKLGESEGNLTYDGKVIGGSEGSSAKEYELFNTDGLTMFAYEVGSPTGDIRPCILYGETFEDVPFKIGTKIEKVEIKTSETAQYRSLTLLNVDTSKPAIPVTNEYFLYKASNTFFLAICMLGLSEQWTDIVDNMNWYSVRITYIDN